MYYILWLHLGILHLVLYSVESWKKKHSLKHLGVPRYVASGTHVNGSNRYRFLVMDQFGDDLEKKFTEHGRKFGMKVVCSLAIQLVCNSVNLQRSSGLYYFTSKCLLFSYRHLNSFTLKNMFTLTSRDPTCCWDIDTLSRYVVLLHP